MGVTYYRLYHFLTQAPWDAQQVNKRHLVVMNQCSLVSPQTKISGGFTLIVDDSRHKTSPFLRGLGTVGHTRTFALEATNSLLRIDFYFGWRNPAKACGLVD